MTTADRMAGVHTEEVLLLLLQRAIYDVYGMTQLHVMHSLGEAIIVNEKAVEYYMTTNRKYNEDTDQGSRENSEKSVTEHDIDRIVCSMYSFVEKRPPNYQAQCKNTVWSNFSKEKGAA